MELIFNRKQIGAYLFSLLLLFTLTSCDKEGDINVFSVQDEIEFGKQLSEEIASDPSTYPLLPETGRNGKNEAAYTYLRSIRDHILSSDNINYKEEFPWLIKIIQKDDELNAFATPGGYIYVYTGLIKYLNSEDQLAGVLAHEIAHSDKRHSTDNLTKAYGWQLLADVVLGKNQGVISDIAKGLVNLSYSRGAEKEADEYSVIYLCDTPYKSDGAAGFFEKMQQQGEGARAPEFLSTHPNPGNRVEAIQQKAQEEGCNLASKADSKYQAFKGLLP